MAPNLMTRKKNTFFKQRFPGFKKKVTELSVICGNSVAFICYGPDNDLHVWPKNSKEISQIVDRFNAQSDSKKKKTGCDLHDFSQDDIEGLCLDELKTRLSQLNSYLVGIRQQQSVILNNSEEIEGHIRVSDNLTVSESM